MLKNTKGYIIVIEGLDGSGKATQTQMLTEHLHDLNLNVKHISFPDYSQPSSTLVKMYLNSEFGDTPQSVNAYAASSFYAVDRYASFMKSWKNFYNSGGIIIVDRYITSNIIYQMVKLPENEWDSFIKWNFDYECNKLGLPYPDMVLYLNVPAEVSQSLMSKRYQGDNQKKDLHEKNIDFQKKCHTAAKYAIDRLNWININCCDNNLKMKSKEDIHTEISKIVNRGLNNE